MMIISNKKYLNSLLTLMHLLFQMIKNINFLADHQIVLTVGSQSPFFPGMCSSSYGWQLFPPATCPLMFQYSFSQNLSIILTS